MHIYTYTDHNTGHKLYIYICIYFAFGQYFFDNSRANHTTKNAMKTMYPWDS